MVFTVLCAILMILAQEGMGLVTQGGGSWQVLNIYKGLTRWAVPALFMVWGMCAMEGGKPNFRSTLLGLALPCFVMLVFWVIGIVKFYKGDVDYKLILASKIADAIVKK